MLKHVPKAARASCCSKLSSIVADICRLPNDTDKWASLLNFGSSILARPVRGGRRQNIARIITNRCDGVAPKKVNTRSGYTRRRDPDASLAAAVASKIEDGNLKAAIRILSSDEKLAEFSAEAASQLQAKHPAAHPDRKPFQDPSEFTALAVTEDQVWKALRSFPAGSRGGPDGFRPQHMVDLASCREAGRELMTNLTAFVNLLLEGRCPLRVANILFGGKLLALNKKDGGIRPIAVGYYWRRLAAKCANAHAIEKLGDYFGCLQVGVGVKGGCEAAIHAARRFDVCYV